MTYRPEIDGLRAIAVGVVILFHAGFAPFAGGYIGVDIFFVISGYLITSILVKDLQEGRFSILKFYERRARRILPALFVVIASCVPFAWLWMYPSQLADFSKGLLAVAFFVSNVLFWQQANYFAPDVDLNPLLHTWSLAVEEQFYIFFPLLLLLLWRWRPQSAPVILLLVAVLSLGLSEIGWRMAPGANFFLIPTRTWELLAGSLCAFAAPLGTARNNNTLATLGLIMILVSVFIFDAETPFPSLYALVPVGGTVLIILYATTKSLVGRLLATRPMVAAGLISYSAYLWHQPLLSFARIHNAEPPSLVLILTLIATTFLLAWLSWRFVEQPFRAGPNSVLQRRSRVFAISGIGIALFAGLGMVGVAGQGLPGRTAPSGTTFAALDIDSRLRANRGLAETCVRGFAALDDCTLGEEPEILLWGDSFAMHLGLALAESSTHADLVQLTKSVCAPILDISIVNAKYPVRWSKECMAFNDRVMVWIEDHPGLRAVVMSSPMGILESRVYQRDGTIASGVVEGLVITKMRETARRIRAAGAVPVFVIPPPRTGKNLASCAVNQLVFNGGQPQDCGFDHTALSYSARHVRDVLATLEPDLRLLSLDEMICDSGRCLTSLDNTIMFIDSGHLSREGSALIGQTYDVTGRILDLVR